MDIRWLTDTLPPSAPINRRTEADYYGASDLIATALGYDSAPPCIASWKHGVSYEKSLAYPELILTEGNRATRHLVGNGWQVSALRKRGFLRVHAVGTPILYLNPPSVTRVPRSLLVMPAHSLVNTAHPFDEDAYVDAVIAAKPHFDVVVACVSPPCVRKGVWTKTFEKGGIPWIPGADSTDRNALRRMAAIFASFESVTSNTMGSHIAYAAHSGCKVSIWGPYAEYRQEDFRGIPWYEKNWKKLPEIFERSSESHVRSRYSWLFKNPWEADSAREWAEPYLGLAHKREPAEVGRLLGWSVIGRGEAAIHGMARDAAHLGRAALQRARRLIAAGN
jgi:hypothetical protein